MEAAASQTRPCSVTQTDRIVDSHLLQCICWWFDWETASLGSIRRAAGLDGSWTRIEILKRRLIEFSSALHPHPHITRTSIDRINPPTLICVPNSRQLRAPNDHQDSKLPGFSNRTSSVTKRRRMQQQPPNGPRAARSSPAAMPGKGCGAHEDQDDGGGAFPGAFHGLTIKESPRPPVDPRLAIARGSRGYSVT